jgi:signal recognition particle subunit SRP72
MTQRIFQSMPILTHTDKHFKYQTSILQRNRYTIDLLSQKYSGVARSTSSIISKSPSPTISPFVNALSVLNAAAKAGGEVGRAGLKRILPLLEDRPKDVGLILTIVQLYILVNSPGSAISLLETFFKRLEDSNTETDLDVRFAPGLVALLVSLYTLSSRKAPIKTELRKSASYWRQKPKPSSNTLLRAAGVSLLESAQPEDLAAAGEIFSSLRSQDSDDRAAVAGYVASYATTDLSKVSTELDRLTPVARLISGIDAVALEEAGIPSVPTLTTVSVSKKRAAEAEADKTEQAPKKRKIRKSKMPKNFEEGKTMDPERWLPLRDRSYYKAKGKKGKKKAMEMTQGGVVKEEESLELAGGAGTVPVQKASGGGNKSNKKKKGKK